MTGWTEGYVTDTAYSSKFHPETAPGHVAFAAISAGKSSGYLMKPRRVLELGFGMGSNLLIQAAANPTCDFEGIEFNPMHVLHARTLIDQAELANVQALEGSFQDFRERGGEQDTDLIIAHGVLSWVSPEARQAVVDIVRRRLRPGGTLYLSYNCMPGWAPFLPLRRLLRDAGRRIGGGSATQATEALKLLIDLDKQGATYLKHYPALQKSLEALTLRNGSYLAHEFCNEHWSVFYFSDVHEMFSAAKLDYLGSATINENIDSLSIPEGLRARIAAEPDRLAAETLRDLASDKRFRRDIYARGMFDLTQPEGRLVLSQFHFMLAQPRIDTTWTMSTLLGDVSGRPEVYEPIAERLALGPASFDEIVALPPLQGNSGNVMLALAMLVHSSQVLAVPAPMMGGDPRPAQRLNRVLAQRSLLRRPYDHVAAPAAGSGIAIARPHLLALAVLLEGFDTVDGVTPRVLRIMDQMGIAWTSRDGAAVTDPNERYRLAAAAMDHVLSSVVPVWRGLGVL